MSAEYDDQRKRFFDAAISGNIQALKEMLDSGYRVNRGDAHLYTALHRVCENWEDDGPGNQRAWASASFLVSQGANVNADNPAMDGWTPLHLSCWSGSFFAVKFLLTHGARPDYRDWYGKYEATKSYDKPTNKMAQMQPLCHITFSSIPRRNT